MPASVKAETDYSSWDPELEIDGKVKSSEDPANPPAAVIPYEQHEFQIENYEPPKTTVVQESTFLDPTSFVNHKPYKAREDQTIKQRIYQASCANFQFVEGLLKANLIESLAKCGFTIGKWGLGDEEYEYDMEIPKAYLLRVRGIVKLLESVEATYLIRGTRNNLDSTIDFEPSRGAILEGMEIEEW